MNLFWSSVYCAYKFIGQDLHADATGAIVTLRFGLAAVLLALCWPWLPGKSPRGMDLLITCVMGVIVAVLGQRLQVYGNQIGTAGNSAVLMGVEPLITSVAAALFLREHLGPRRVAGFALALLGVALLHGVWRADFKMTSLAASLIFISSFVCEAAYSVLGKLMLARASALKILTLGLLAALVVNLLIDGPTTLAVAKVLSVRSWLLLLGLALICTAIGYGVWLVVIRESPVNVVALTIYSQSIFGVAMAALWLGERLHWDQLIGSLTIAAGLVLGLSRQVRVQRP
jgi:drug/metabolite transporter (DMT)-like permease